MKKNSSILRTLLAAVFMLSVLSLTMVFGTKAYAAGEATITVTDSGAVKSTSVKTGTSPYAIKVMTDLTVTSENGEHSYTFKSGNIFYFDKDGNLAELTADAAVPFFTGVDTTSCPNKALAKGKATPSGTTYTSTIQLKSGSIGSTVYPIYQNGDLYNNGYVWESSKLYSVSNGKKGALKTGVVTGTYYDAASKTFKSFGNGWYVKNGVLTTAAVNLRLYNNGKFDNSTTGWKKIGNNIYYFKKGKAVTGWNYLPSYGKGVKSYTYLFNGKGVLYTDLIWGYYGYKNFLKKNIKIIVNKRTHNTTFYTTDSKGNYTVPCLTIVCATAKKKGDTPNGTFRLEKTWNKRWYVYTKTNGAPYRYYQWAVKIHHTSSLFHSSTYRKKSAKSLRVDLYNKIGTSCTTHCVRHQARYAKLIYDIATYKINVMKWRKHRIPVQIITSPNEGPYGHVGHKKVSKGTKWDPTDPNKK